MSNKVYSAYPSGYAPYTNRYTQPPMSNQDSEIIRMYYPEESSTGKYDVIKVDTHNFKLVSNDPFVEKLSFGTIIEVEPEMHEREVYKFKRIVSESEYKSESLFLPSELNETELRIVGNLIVKEGGYWEVVFGGIGIVNLPLDSKLDVTKELNKLIEAKGRV